MPEPDRLPVDVADRPGSSDGQLLRVVLGGAIARDDLLGFRFGPWAPGIGVACTPVGATSATERWLASLPAAEREIARRSGGLASIWIEVDEAEAGGIEAAAELAYRRLLAAVRGTPHPHLLRIWNHFPDINAGDGDAERYRRFCVGRARAVDEDFASAPPAATAIGTVGDAPARLQVVALAGSEPGLAIENPRQTPAWRYPRDYGPVSPGFSRATLVGQGARARLLVSGTASIVGHRSCHPGDVAAQLEETLRNLDALLGQASTRAGVRFDPGDARAVRAYLRDPQHAPAVRSRLARVFDPARCLLLQGDVCRRELLVEIEGVFAPVAG